MAQSDFAGRFLTELSKFRDAYKSIGMKTLARRLPGKCINLGALVSVSTESSEQVPPVQETFGDNLVFMAESVPFTGQAIAQVIRSAVDERILPVQDLKISIDRGGSPTIELHERRVLLWGEYFEVSKWPIVTLHFSGNRIRDHLGDHETIRQMEDGLKKKAYADIEDLSRNLLGYRLTMDYQSVFVMFFPVYARVSDLELRADGTTRGTLELHKSIKPRDVELAAKVVSATESTVLRHPQVVLKPLRSESDFEVFEFETEGTIVEASNATVYGFVKGTRFWEQVVYQKEVTERHNPLLKVHRSFDPDLSYLRNGLKERGENLEEYVAVLLHLAGLSVEHLGGIEKRTGSRMVDLAAFSGDRMQVLVVGCTAALTKPDKIIAIAQKAGSLRTKLKDTGIEVHAVCVSTVPGEEIPASVKQAAQTENVRVIDQALLSRMQEVVESGKGEAEMLDMIRSQVSWWHSGF